MSALRRFALYPVFLFLVISRTVSAAPWVQADDLRLKNNLHLLHDAGVLNLSLSTWPILWADIKRALDGVDAFSLSPALRSAARELEFELRKQSERGIKRQLSIGASNARDLLSAPGRLNDDKFAISHFLDWDGQQFAFKLQANAQRVNGETHSDLYGSYFAGVFGSWVLGAGAIDRWWGPGRQSSLILSDNAEPVPGLFFRTLGEQQFESAWLSWIGAWQFEVFVGQMESRRVVPEAKLTGMRLSIRPLDSLEIGFSRMMQWGGDGRSESLRTIWNSLTSQGENDGDNAGNQLAGVDARYGFSVMGMPSAIYTQMIGEDEAGYLPAHFVVQFGAESVLWQSGAGHYLGLFAEYNDTLAGAPKGTHPNVAYNHSVYNTGLRHRGRVMAAMYDNDARVVSVGASWQQSNGVLSQLTLSKLNLNRDDVPDGNSVSLRAQSLYQADLYHQRIVFDGRLKLGMNLRNRDFDSPQGDIDRLTFYVSWDHRY